MARAKFEKLIRESSLDEAAKNEILEKNNSNPTFTDEDEKSLKLARVILNSPYDSKNRSLGIRNIIYFKNIDDEYIQRLKERLSVIQDLINAPNTKHIGFRDSANCDTVLRFAANLSEDITKDQLKEIKANMALTSLLIEYGIIEPTVFGVAYVRRQRDNSLIELKDYLLDNGAVSEDFTKLIDKQKDLGVFLDKCLETKNSSAIEWLINNDSNLDKGSKHFFNINLESILNKEGTTLAKAALQKAVNAIFAPI